MKVINQKAKKIILVFIVVTIVITVTALFMPNKKSKDAKEKINNYITLSNVEQIQLSKDVIVLNKIDLTSTQKSMLDIDNNTYVDEHDLNIFKKIINNNFDDINNDGSINNKDLTLLKQALLNKKEKSNKKYDLNYDQKFDELDLDLLQRYITNIIDLDINQDQTEDYEDINILEKYINSKKQIEVLLPHNYTDKSIKWDIEDSHVITIDDNAFIYPKKEGITTVSVKDYKNNTDECIVIVLNSNIKEETISLNKERIYLKPAYLTTVETSESDINKDNKINALDLKLLKDIIKLQFGNINGDKTTDAKDLDVLNNYIKGNNDSNINIIKLDINKDGLINNNDYKLLYSYLYGNQIGDINKDNQVENRDIKIINDYINSYYQLYVIFNPNNVINKKITWKSKDTSVASITPEGIVHAHKEGKTTITATTEEGLKTECEVIVSQKTAVPYELETTDKKISLKYFDYKNNDILKIDFNYDGTINKKDQQIASKILKIKNQEELLKEILQNIIKKEKYDKKYDINEDKKITTEDYAVIYNLVNEIKTGDINKDNKFDKEDISLIDDYINSMKNIKVEVKSNNTMDRILYLPQNSNIVQVNNRGKIQAINKGTTKVTTITVNGITKTIDIIVK